MDDVISTYPMKNSTILRLGYDRDVIDTDPEYQRRGEVWSEEKRQLLIDSILNDYDIPKIYFHSFKKPKKKEADEKEYLYAIIDGKQRIETIWMFLENKFALDPDFKYIRDEKVKAGGLMYNELGTKYPKLKVIFDSFVLPIICVETDEIAVIEDMFSRLNEAVPLNAAEKRNAMGGPMPQIIRDVSEHKFFDEKVRFTDRRYQFKEEAARLLFLEDSLSKKKLVDTKKVYLDNFVVWYKKNPDQDPAPLAKAVKGVLNVMYNIFDKEDRLLRSQAAVPIYYLLIKLAVRQGAINSITRAKLSEFSAKVESNRELAETDLPKADFELLEYDRLSIQGTNDASSIRERVRIISKFFGINGEMLTD